VAAGGDGHGAGAGAPGLAQLSSRRRVVARASVVAVTAVELLFIRKADLFAATTYDVRQQMRKNAIRNQKWLTGGNVTTRKLQDWSDYKKQVVGEAVATRLRKVEERQLKTHLAIAIASNAGR
jgi:hypothetical protein